ncbi:MAG: hypothetical protein R3268_08785 [Acidiferrobacterales bacterium]|nr:hypothetical protein [Acidiferrobacterales bacterium]
MQRKLVVTAIPFISTSEGTMKNRVIGLLLVAAGFTALTGCSKIEEPWVQSQDQLKMERERPQEQQQALRHRLLTAAGVREIDLAD